MILPFWPIIWSSDSKDNPRLALGFSSWSFSVAITRRNSRTLIIDLLAAECVHQRIVELATVVLRLAVGAAAPAERGAIVLVYPHLTKQRIMTTIRVRVVRSEFGV